MSSRTDVEVIIGGKVFTLSGYESEEYLQKVASYINNKINEYSKIASFKKQPADMQNFLLQLNIADDYFKAKKQISLLEEEIQRKEKGDYVPCGSIHSYILYRVCIILLCNLRKAFLYSFRS